MKARARETERAKIRFKIRVKIRVTIRVRAGLAVYAFRCDWNE